MTHVAIKATVEWRLLLGTTEGWLNTTTMWSSISCDRHRADHVTKIHSETPDLLLHLPSPVLEGEVCAAVGVCDNEVSFKRMTISSCSQSGACSLAVVALFWNLSVLGVLEVHTSLARPALWYLCYIYGRLLRETLGVLLLWACLHSAAFGGCSSFFCRKSPRVSGLNGVDPGAPLFLTPYLEKGAIDEGKLVFVLLRSKVL